MQPSQYMYQLQQQNDQKEQPAPQKIQEPRQNQSIQPQKDTEATKS